jgi:hypothetical protein
LADSLACAGFSPEAARDDAVERLGDLGDALADEIMEPARRHDRDDGIFEERPAYCGAAMPSLFCALIQ